VTGAIKDLTVKESRWANKTPWERAISLLPFPGLQFAKTEFLENKGRSEKAIEVRIEGEAEQGRRPKKRGNDQKISLLKRSCRPPPDKKRT